MSTVEEPCDDSFEVLSEKAHVIRVEDVPAMLRRAGPSLGATEMTVYVAEYSQRLLVPLAPGRSAQEPPLPIDGSLAGRAYRDSSVHRTSQDGGRHVWLPLLDGTERLGVLEAVLDHDPDDAGLRRLVAFAGLIAATLISRSAYGDAFELARRRLPMSLAAELQWTQLPPLTYTTEDVTISAVLEPCYDIGGDSFDYAVNGHTLHAALFDAVGHGIGAAELMAVALAAYRNGRRSGLDLMDTAHSVDRWISQRFPEAFVTAVLLELRTDTGQLLTVNAGHPSALVFRGGHLIKSLPGPTRLPLGLGPDFDDGPAEVTLQAGDRLLLFSDGIVEARSAEGQEFALDRLVDFMGRQLFDELPAPETMRRLVHRILQHQKDELQDDATALLIDWSPPGSGRATP